MPVESVGQAGHTFNFWTHIMTTTIWHNPRCSKSRQTLTLLEERGISAAVRLYLDDAPSTTEVAEVLNQLGIAPWELLRRSEKVFKELGLDKNTADQALIEAMSANPILIERPIVIHAGRAALGRPPESVLGLLD